MVEVSIVVPVLDEEESLPILQRRIERVMKALKLSYEIIYVDDASTDSSLDIMKELKEKNTQIHIISFKEHRGQSVALIAGFRAARGKWILTLDADMQNPPGDIVKLWKYSPEYDFITGIRARRRDSLIRRTSSVIARRVRNFIIGDSTVDVGCSLRLFKRDIIDGIEFFKNFHRFFTFLARNRGWKIKEVGVKHSPRKFGKSKYGTFDRLRAGLFDLVGVLWLKARSVDYEIKFDSG